MAKITGLKLDVDGTLSDFEADSEDMLKPLYAAIGCDLVDVVRIERDLEYWLDDEGLYTQERNPYAKAMGEYLTGVPWSPIAGPVVILGGIDEEGYSVSLSPARTDLVRRLIASATTVTVG